MPVRGWKVYHDIHHRHTGVPGLDTVAQYKVAQYVRMSPRGRRAMRWVREDELLTMKPCNLNEHLHNHAAAPARTSSRCAARSHRGSACTNGWAACARCGTSEGGHGHRVLTGPVPSARAQ